MDYSEDKKDIQVVEINEVSNAEDASAAGFMMRMIQESAQEKRMLSQVNFEPVMDAEVIDTLIKYEMSELKELLDDASISREKRVKLIQIVADGVKGLQKHRRLMTGRTYSPRTDVMASLRVSKDADGNGRQTYELGAINMEEDY